MYFANQTRPYFGRCLAYLLCGVTLLSIVACGKATKESPASSRQEEQINPSEMEAQLSRQSVSCDNGLACPDAIAKVVVVDRARLRTCTGFLVNSLIVATAASCLTEKLRASDNDRLCQSDVHLFFPRSDFRGAKRVNCKRFLLKTPILETDPVLWRNDLVYIELSEPITRRPLRISRDGMLDGDTATMWKVDQENDQVGIIRKTTCKSVLNSYVNPLSTSRYSPNLLISNCQLKTGNKGAPILDDKGLWQGVYSGPVSSSMMNFINTSGYLIEPLMSIGHVSNTVCLPALRDDNPVTRKECGIEMDYAQVDRSRAALLSSPATHEVERLRIAEEASELRPYIQWDAELIQDGEKPGSFKVKFKPKCLKPINSWIRNFRDPPRKLTYTMTVPDWRLTIGLDRAARLVSRVDDDRRKTINVEFSPGQARSSRSSYVKVWSGNVTNTYSDVTEACE